MATVLEADRFLERPTAMGQLLAGAVATTSGTWFEVHGARPLNVTAEGTFSATVEFRGSCSVAKPLDSVHGILLGSAITSADSVIIDAPYMWVKARVTAYTSGSIDAFVFGG